MTERLCLDENQLLEFIEGRMSGVHVDDLTQHLDRCSACRMLVSAAAGVDAPSPLERVDRPSRSFAVGDVVGSRYRIEKFLARGGMGEVYQARDLLLDMRIALKTLAATIADDARATTRLKNEVQIARKVTHDNVCRLFDLGVHGGGDDPSRSKVPGLIFITMELLEGETLGERLRRAGRLAPADAVPIVRQLTEGLSAAHRAGVIHRDFKSDNIMLVPGPDGRERVVITDFGLARLRAPDWPSVELSGQGLLGTMAYVAPEQIRGLPATPATDLYSLGVVLFEMLTGQLPFRGETVVATALMRLEQPPPSPAQLVPAIGPRWESIVMRCLALDPAGRFAAAEEIARCLPGPDDGAATVGQVAPAPPVKRAPRHALAATLAVVVVGVAGAIVLATRPSSVDSAPPRAATVAAPPETPRPPPAAPAAPSPSEPRPAAGEPAPTTTSTPPVVGEVAAPTSRNRTARQARNRSSKRGAANVAPGTTSSPSSELPARESPDKTPLTAPSPEHRHNSNDDDVIDPFARSR